MSIGMYYLAKREIMRFLKIINETIFPSIISSLLFLAIFHFVIGKSTNGSDYLQFLVPGLTIMNMINNSFINSAFSVFISKFTHHFEHILTMPLSYLELTTAYVSGSVARGFLTGISVLIATSFFVSFTIYNIFILVLYGLFATILFGSIGVLVALMAKQFDHLGVFNTFFLTPLTMLGGVFYSIKVLPPLFQKLVLFNPLFYLVDGFRYGLLGISDSSLIQGMIISLILSVGFFSLVVYLMKKGYKVKE